MNNHSEKNGFSQKVKVPGRGQSDHKYWNLEEDSSIHAESGQIAVEIVSPVLTYDASPTAAWREELNHVFESLSDYTIQTNKTCGTHIHVSPTSGEWKLNDLKKLACFTLYSEYALKYFNYEDRERRRRYAAENGRDNPSFSGLLGEYTRIQGLKDFFQRIFETKDISEFVSLMNQKRFVEGVEVGERYYALNFTNLEGPLKTIEYRSPPGITRSDTGQNLVDFVITLVTAGTSISNTDTLLKERPNDSLIADLKGILGKKLPEDLSKAEYFGKIFDKARAKKDARRRRNKRRRMGPRERWEKEQRKRKEHRRNRCADWDAANR